MLVAECYEARKAEANARFERLKANEEELNRIFARVYGMEGEVPIAVEERFVSVARIFDRERDIPESLKGGKFVRTRRDEIVALVSYGVGCMLGRYSLDVDGLVLANQGDDLARYLEKVPEPSLLPSDDGILAISGDGALRNDVVASFADFLATAYGEGDLLENLRFIAEALGGRGELREAIRSYFRRGFFKDHCRAYQRRPIYWLLDSGARHGFSALFAVHRYTPGLLARVHEDYLPRQRALYEAMIAELEGKARGTSREARVAAEKGLARVCEQLDELEAYDARVRRLARERIELDLNDGVKANYAKLGAVLAKIP